MHSGQRLTEPHFGWNAIRKRCSNYIGAWSRLGANGWLRSTAAENTLMLPTNRPLRKGGKSLVFHIWAITKERKYSCNIHLKFSAATPIQKG